MKKVISGLLVLALLVGCTCLAAAALPAGAEIPDDARISEDTFTVMVTPPTQHPAEEEICTLVDASIKKVVEYKNEDGELTLRIVIYTLNQPGREAVIAAIDRINSTYPVGEILAEPSYITGIDDPGPLTVADVVQLRKLILATGTPSAQMLEKYDFSHDGLLSITDVVLMRQAILKG